MLATRYASITYPLCHSDCDMLAFIFHMNIIMWNKATNNGNKLFSKPWTKKFNQYSEKFEPRMGSGNCQFGKWLDFIVLLLLLRFHRRANNLLIFNFVCNIRKLIVIWIRMCEDSPNVLPIDNITFCFNYNTFVKYLAVCVLSLKPFIERQSTTLPMVTMHTAHIIII